MKKTLLILLLSLVVAQPSTAALKVVTTLPAYAAIAQYAPQRLGANYIEFQPPGGGPLFVLLLLLLFEQTSPEHPQSSGFVLVLRFLVLAGNNQACGKMCHPYR